MKSGPASRGHRSDSDSYTSSEVTGPSCVGGISASIALAASRKALSMLNRQASSALLRQTPAAHLNHFALAALSCLVVKALHPFWHFLSCWAGVMA